ncbi:CLIP-associated protein [Vitis vinifera]|uniref:CLIP-associated protein n=1 Tax=Vitis vinifera TaxID=29760 RepID=A0A438F1Q5_VITVI|nr:CLIP-associated protein [Vitis vinifera]
MKEANWCWDSIKFKVGKGSRVKFWIDQWCGIVALSQNFPQLFALAVHKNAMINEVWDSSLGQGGIYGETSESFKLPKYVVYILRADINASFIIFFVLLGAADYPGFRGLLKQLVGPLSIQLSDRRSSIVKQTCHLLIFFVKRALGRFESCAEMFIPVLFKLVVITVLVIAESADNCIKTMLRNCKVARVLPKIADCAKNDRNAVLRARCCEYSLLILEYWADAPEIQRSADLYEDLIKCCVADAMSEVFVSDSFPFYNVHGQ